MKLFLESKEAERKSILAADQRLSEVEKQKEGIGSQLYALYTLHSYCISSCSYCPQLPQIALQNSSYKPFASFLSQFLILGYLYC